MYSQLTKVEQSMDHKIYLVSLVMACPLRTHTYLDSLLRLLELQMRVGGREQLAEEMLVQLERVEREGGMAVSQREKVIKVLFNQAWSKATGDYVLAQLEGQTGLF